jgi:signal transduction histidine kinase
LKSQPAWEVLAGGGEVNALMRARDWASTPVGPPETWPQSLRAIVRVMLTSRFAMWMAWGPELTFFCNDAYLPTVGIKRDWVIGSRSDRVWAEIWPDIGPRIERVLSTGEATWDEALLLYLERSGFAEETYHTFSYSPLADDSGAIAGMLCVVAEVTERVIGERQLAVLRDLGVKLAGAATRAELMSALEACLAADPRDVPFALAYLRDGSSDEATLTAAHGVAWERAAQLHGMGSGNGASVWPLDRVLRSGESLSVEAPPELIDGLKLNHWQSSPERAFVVPIKGAEGESPVGVLVVGLNPHRAFDVAYRGFIELLTGQLSAAVARADDYERERARAAALAEIDRAKTAFFSNISHEFRTPLTLMIGPLEDALVDSVALTPVQQERLDIAHRNALRLLRLVNSLLDFSRIEAGRVRATFRPIDLSALTAEIASGFRSAIERAGLRFVVETPPLARPVYADREMWEKIVLNLLSNAFKFTWEGEIAISLSELDGRAQLVVSDSGVGIPEDELPRLFERFHRVEGARGRSFEGSGIGLALVHELVKLHGGAVSVESGVGRGTTFTVSIPFGAAHLPADRVEAEESYAETPAGARSFVEEALRWLPANATGALLETETAIDLPQDAAPLAEAVGRCVLVADDNADLRDYIARLLTEKGYEVVTAGDGDEALTALKDLKPDLLLTDVMMPGLDGFGLLRAIRESPELRELPVVMLSARAGEEAKVDGLGAGADDYLTKPFSARELLARVASGISMARVRREAADAVRASEAALRELNEDLESRVARAIAEREEIEDALRQAQKMEAVGQLTGGIAHDFNNLLTVITGNVDMARRALGSGENSRALRALENAQKGAQRAAALTQRLLAFSRRQPLAPKVVNVDRLITGMSDLLHRALGEQVQLETVSTPGLWRVEVDPNQLESAILNLAVNSRDAMTEGGKLTIETANARLDDQYSAAHVEVAPGHYVVVAVTDTGNGMSKETLARVFDPFFTTKGVGKGTGLGLSMVYGFVKQSGGHVKIYSELNEGTTVKIYLPRVMNASEADEKEEAAEVDRMRRDQRILVVEDDDDVRAYTVEILRELGYRVLEAHDAPSALSLLERQEQRIDLLFTDIVMPGLSGRELAETAHQGHPAIKVLFTTGYAHNAIVHGGRLDPGVEMIAKPFTYQGLAQKIADVLDAGRTGRVLIVENDETARMFAAQALLNAGAAIDEAATASEALARLRAAGGRYDAVLLDLPLPDKGGESLVAELRAMHADLPILIATNEHASAMRDRFAEDRRVKVIHKPYNAARLQAALEELRARSRAGFDDSNLALLPDGS